MTREGVGKFLKVSSLLTVLCSFFVYAASRWINGIEIAQAKSIADVLEIRSKIEETKSEVRSVRAEMAGFAREIIGRLERIERKMDRQ